MPYWSKDTETFCDVNKRLEAASLVTTAVICIPLLNLTTLDINYKQFLKIQHLRYDKILLCNETFNFNFHGVISLFCVVQIKYGLTPQIYTSTYTRTQ